MPVCSSAISSQVSLCLCSQKYTHVRLSQRGSSKPYYKSVLWWLGISLMGLGELGNFAAYGFAPASLIAPLGCVSVIGKQHSSIATTAGQSSQPAHVLTNHSVA